VIQELHSGLEDRSPPTVNVKELKVVLLSTLKEETSTKGQHFYISRE